MTREFQQAALCWLSWLKVSEGNSGPQSYSLSFHPTFRRFWHWIWFNGSVNSCFCFVLFFSYSLWWCNIKVLTVWKYGQMYPFSCRSWWRWMHSCVTKDGKEHLTAAQWHGFVMAFIVKECLSIILEALLNLSPPGSAHLESRFRGFMLRLTERNSLQ